MYSDGRGLFIVFEGIDGSGADTQLKRLYDTIKHQDKYQDILATHEPWKNERIKEMLAGDKDAYSNAEEISQLYVGDRTDHSYSLIIPNLNAGVFVLSSRYKMSTCAFQQAQGVPLEVLLRMHENRGILTPDLTFYLDVPKEVAAERIMKRGDSIEKFERDPEFVDKVIGNYRSLVEMSYNEPGLFGEVIQINGTPSEDEVAEKIYKTFIPFYREWKGLDVHWGNLLYLQKKFEKKNKPNQ